MAEQNGPEGAPAAPEGQPPAGNAGAPAANADDGASSAPESISLEDARKLRSENKGLRDRLKGFEDAERERAEASKTSEQRTAEQVAGLTRERDEARAAQKTMALEIATIGVARKLGFRDPDLAHRLIASDEIDYDESGKPRNVEKLLTEVAKAHPYLVNGSTDFGGGPRTPPPSAGDDMNAFIRRKAGRA